MYAVKKLYRVASLALAVSLALALTACGRRGDLEPPRSAAVQKQSESGEPAFHKSVPRIMPPKQSFVLDPLLQ